MGRVGASLRGPLYYCLVELKEQFGITMNAHWATCQQTALLVLFLSDGHQAVGRAECLLSSAADMMIGSGVGL